MWWLVTHPRLSQLHVFVFILYLLSMTYHSVYLPCLTCTLYTLKSLTLPTIYSLLQSTRNLLSCPTCINSVYTTICVCRPEGICHKGIKRWIFSKTHACSVPIVFSKSHPTYQHVTTNEYPSAIVLEWLAHRPPMAVDSWKRPTSTKADIVCGAI